MWNVSVSLFWLKDLIPVSVLLRLPNGSGLARVNPKQNVKRLERHTFFSGRTTKGLGRVNPLTTKQKPFFF